MNVKQRDWLAHITGTDMPRTLPGHDTCKTHRLYKLSCRQYERLLARAGGLCEICSEPPEAGRPKLNIDHGPGARWRVRGLLCTGCNTQLRSGVAFCDPAAVYLAAEWWRTECALLGIPAEIGPEPPLGAAIRNQWGTIWIRCSDDRAARWHAPNQLGHGWPNRDWRGLYDAYGAQNLVPYDLDLLLATGGLDAGERHVYRDVLDGEFWMSVRDALAATGGSAGVSS